MSSAPKRQSSTTVSPQASLQSSSKPASCLNDQIAAFFKESRLAAGVTVDEIEKQIDIPAESMIAYESGAKKFPLDEIFALTNFLNIPPEDVLSLIYDLSAGRSR